MLKLQNVKKDVDESFQLGPISFDVEAGMTYALVGNNGAGKSTLFQIIMDLVHRDEGQIIRLQETGSATGWKAAFAYVPQTTKMYQGFSLQQLADFFMMSYPGWDQTEFKRLIEMFHLPLKKQMDKMSAGMQKKAMLALALARPTTLLLLDEPLAGVDIEGQEQMKDELVRYMERGKEQTIVFATHSADEVKVLADYITLMKDGQLAGRYEKDSLMTVWKRIWVRTEGKAIPSMNSICQIRSQGSLTECIVSDIYKAEEELSRHGLTIETTQQLELGEILRYLLKYETNV
ncbi:ATP-binding cassette domain-containing protein [Bacillus sp. FJAT-45037]|uniref:ATP-binding cassette domain-containing protein n=1 Tax=Bacillus sp. FJAT-45037 TaxID=2011007 RepID=UPI000C25177C|nr:ABC transporter ATP-binding protein [Bacillus sp. FJAT-45037]